MIPKTKSIFIHIWELLKISWHEDKLLFILYFASALLGAVLLFVVYYFYKLMIDQVAAASTLSGLNTLTLVIITYLFFEYLSRFVNFTFNQYYFDYLIKTKLQNLLTRMFIRKMGQLDFSSLEDGDVRNLIAKVESTYTARLPDILHTINSIVFNLAALVFSLVVAFRFNPVYFIILGLVSAPVYYLRAKYGNIAWSAFSSNASSANYLWYIRSLFTNFNNLSEIKIYGLNSHFLEKTEHLQNKILEDYRRPITIYSILSTVSFILVPVAIFFALSHFLATRAENNFTLGDFTLFLNALFTFSGQISSILVNVGSISENNFYLGDFLQLMNIKNILTHPANPYVFSDRVPREIVFENVSFSYPGTTNQSLKNINLTIKKGENIALVGHNGAGKSTLIKLLLRFYDPTKGRITVDGIDLKDIDLDDWYKHIGVLFQDFARYFLTLKENVIFGNIRDHNSENIVDALELAQADQLIKAMPKGLDQIVGRWFHSGIELSGGQWQKVAIARAIFRNAPILVMDEPTSNIDAEAEAEIFSNLRTIYQDKTLLFISHRFSTIRTADRIFVLENGQLVEQGTHAELMQKPGLYAKFFNTQKKGYH